MMKTSDAYNKLRDVKKSWGLTDEGEPFSTRYSLLQPVRHAGFSAMLKIPFATEDVHGFALMACWNGVGSARVYRFDAGALLMERATGPLSLRRMVLTGNEDEANRIVCRVAGQLHTAGCRQTPGLIPLSDWFRSLEVAAVRYSGWFTTAFDIARVLLDAPQEVVALHGDIHYDNILDSGYGDWIAIDPKGLLGERGFDFANLFCNPSAAVAVSPERLSKQVRLVAGQANLEVKRLLHWIIAWCGLSASWLLEEGENAQVPLHVGQLAGLELQCY